MNKSEASWTRCAKEFAATAPRPSIIVKIPLSLAGYDKSATRIGQVTKLDFKNGRNRRGVVATDAALAGLDQIDTSEFVAKWIAEGICTPPASENCGKVDEDDENTLIKSPRIKIVPRRRDRGVNRSLPGVTKSPIFKKRKRDVLKECRVEFGLWDTIKLDESLGSSDYDKSARLGNESIGSRRKHKPNILRRRLQDRLESENNSFTSLKSKQNEKEINFRSIDAENEVKKPRETISVTETQDETILARLDTVDTVGLSQDLFDDELIITIPQLVRISSPEKRDEGAGLPGRSCDLSPPPLSYYGSRSEIEPEENVCDEKTKGHRSLDFIQDTEDLPKWKSWEKFLGSSQREERHLILDTELTPEKEKYVPDTERIDYESSSDNEEKRKDSDSDKTVSDLIEEPITQDYLEISKSAAILSWRSDLKPYSPRKSISALSPMISETISLNEPNSPQISINNISTETTPPRTQESFAPAAGLLDSAKKKKSKPKKGSLGAKLQKLISGQASSVRLWRHQMSSESGFEKSSPMSITLMVVEAWVQYGKNLYRSKVLNDPYNLLNGYFEREESKEKGRSLVVMTNPDYVGSVKLRAWSVFKIYSPWDVFNFNSNGEDLVLHSMYFNVVSNPAEVKLEPNDGVEKPSDKLTHSKVTREFDCPCLRNGRLDNSCSTKFTDHKVDIIAEIIK